MIIFSRVSKLVFEWDLPVWASHEIKHQIMQTQQKNYNTSE